MDDNQIITTMLPHVDLLDKIRDRAELRLRANRLENYLHDTDVARMREQLADLRSWIDD
jgi:hypothetical protein